jgi:hypothetical protein
MNGDAALAALRAAGLSVPVIAVSGHVLGAGIDSDRCCGAPSRGAGLRDAVARAAAAAAARRYTELGFDAALPKPFSRDNMMEAVRAVYRRPVSG